MSSSTARTRTPRDQNTGPLDESLTASELRGLVGDRQILVSYDGGTKFGILGEDFDGDTFPVRKLQARHGPLTDDWEPMDRHYFVVEGPYRDPEAGDRGKADITEDLTEAQLVEASFSTDVVVYWPNEVDGGVHYGIICGYQDPPEGAVAGLFQVEIVDKLDEPPYWKEWGQEVPMGRGDFQVFGPANREKGDPPQVVGPIPLTIALPFYAKEMFPYLLCAMDIMGMETEVGQPTFKVRLDVRPDPSGGHRFRVGVQPVEQPIMHDEISDVLMVASKYNLSVSTSSAGLDITAPEDVV